MTDLEPLSGDTKPSSHPFAVIVQRTSAVIGIVLGALGLAGLRDNIERWQGFMANLMPVYLEVRDAIFSVLPFDLSDFWKTYLILGLAYFGAMAHFAADTVHALRKKGRSTRRLVFMMGFMLAVYVLLWPVFLLVKIPAYFYDYGLGEAYNRYQKQLTLRGAAHVFAALGLYLCVLFVYWDFSTP